MILSFGLVLFFGCEQNSKQIKKSPREIDDSSYAMFYEYKIGDSRRYGVFPDSSNTQLNKKTKKDVIGSLLELAEKEELEVFFTKGNYPHDLNIKGKRNVSLRFYNSTFNALIIGNKESAISEKIQLKGIVNLVDRFGILLSKNVFIDTLKIGSDTDAIKSRGCHIYRGTQDLNINYLQIEDLGSKGLYYKNSHAALVIDGQGDNPENVTINKVRIKSSDRHGAYITGKNNEIKEIVIEEYGLGTSLGMSRMQEVEAGQEKIFSGLWLNRCNNCILEEVYVITKSSNSGYPFKFDEGNQQRPTVIEKMAMDVPYKDELVLDDILTNVLVKEIEIKGDR